jgi:hypothetical protein
MVINCITRGAVTPCHFTTHNLKYFDTNKLSFCLGLDIAGWFFTKLQRLLLAF